VLGVCSGLIAHAQCRCFGARVGVWGFEYVEYFYQNRQLCFCQRLECLRREVLISWPWITKDKIVNLTQLITPPDAILFTTYNRTLSLLSSTPSSTPLQIWCAGAAGGLATFIVSAPTEFVKCRAQVSTANTSSWTIAKETWRKEGIRGLYTGGGITSVRDAVGYGF
jgi:hypothetical protein